MARMIPATFHPDTASGAERQLFTELERQLPDDVVLLHSSKWVSRDRDGFLIDGEADFSIWHPRLGLMILEVKGGGISFNRRTGDWHSVDRTGRGHRISDPFRQAERTMHVFVDKLRDDRRTQRYRYPFCRGVAFPDCRVGSVGLGPEVDRDMVIDVDDIGDLNRAIERTYALNRFAAPLADGAIEAALQVFTPEGELRPFVQLSDLAFNELEMVRLTEQQFALLRALRTTRQGAINGCAGSGKTMLAIEKARQLAEEGFEVLLTCYNKALAAWIREGVAGQTSPAMKRITVLHYHDLARILTERAGVSLDGRFGEPSFWEETLPGLFADAIPGIDTRFDAIIADEGQDFATEWWFTLRELLRDPDSGVFYIFQDARQALYRDPEDLPVPVMTLELTDNCRNTARIHDLGVVYARGAPNLESRGPQGRTVEHIDAPETDVLRTLRRILTRLIDQEGFRADQIVILTPASEGRSVLTTGAMLGNRRLRRDMREGPNDIQVSTIHGFKGLESPVVILAEMNRIPSSIRNPDHLSYVAITRARHHLIVIGTLPEPQSDRKTTVA